jgi:hypothetical protein
MKTKRLVLACGLVALSTIMFACNSGFVEYQPLKLQTGAQNKLVSAPELNTSGHVERVKAVLDFYGEKWQTDDSGKLLVTRKLSRDKELLWNYTNKAEDPQFVENARKKKSEGQ